jgi:hypothetical protein
MFKSYFIAVFKLAVVSTLVLYSIISQMNKSVLHILNIIFPTARPKIAFSVKVSLEITINSGCQCIQPYIELPLFIQ